MSFPLATRLGGLVALLVAASWLAAGALATSEIDRAQVDRLRRDLFDRVDRALGEVEAFGGGPQESEGWAALAERIAGEVGVRTSLWGGEGHLLGGSERRGEGHDVLEERADREEFTRAARTGRGWSIRTSARTRERILHVAVPFRSRSGVEGYVRLVAPLGAFDRTVAAARSRLALGGVAALLLGGALAALLGRGTSRAIDRATASLDRMTRAPFSPPVVSGRSLPEIALLEAALDRLGRGVSRWVEDLREERDLLGGVLAGMQEGVLLLDPLGRVELVNPALRDMLLLAGEPRGRSLLEVVRHGELQALLERARAEPRGVTAEIDAGGLKPRRLLLRAAPLGGAHPATLAVLVDVTEIRRLELMRRDFVANVSHELRTPVTSVLTAVDTLEGGAARDPEALPRFLGILRRNADRLHHLVGDLLDLSRIESKEFHLVLEPVPLAPLVDQILALHGDRARAAGVSLASTVPSALVVPRGDRRALEQILGNLVDNAVKYAGRGAAVTVAGEATPGGVRLSVQDTGAGIEEKHLPRLFERFYRVDPGRSREMGGTGLGLAIVKHLAVAMGGAVAVESAPGRGSLFSVTLPTERGEGRA